jgi:cell division protein FtsZ
MSSTTPLRLLVGIGNAGVTVLDRISLERPGMKGLMVVNSDAESLAASVVARRIHVPGEDLREGFLAIETEFKTALSGVASVVLCGGLGGEIGSFLLPALAALAKANGVVTLAGVGMPFAFEGRQRRESAAAALRKLHDLCDAVAVIDNDRLSGGVPSTAAVGEAFGAADRMLQASILALQGMLSTSGPVKITRGDLASVLGVPGAATHFGYGHAEGSNRLHEALEKALKSPLLSLPGKGSALRESRMVLVLLSGPSDLSFAEVQRAVGEIERIAGDNTHVRVGVHATGASGAPLELSLVTSSGVSVKIGRQSEAVEAGSPTTPHPAHSSEESSIPGMNVSTTPSRQAPKPSPRASRSGNAKQTQGVFDLENYQRGRFDKSEPTIVAGEDLDIPTFLRKGIKIGSPTRH